MSFARVVFPVPEVGGGERDRGAGDQFKTIDFEYRFGL